jgi:2'-hydroxyisoflavone reductase
MKLLILGGARFLGRHVMAAGLARGHRVSAFNRGRTEPDLFPEIEKLRGDRAGDLSVLDGRTWDAVIDTSGYLPEDVGRLAERLRGRVGHYTFVSSISVYAGFAHAGMDEGSPVSRLTPDQRSTVAGIDRSEPLKSQAFLQLYGPLKAVCEIAVQEHFGDRALVLRPGLIVGPHDYMDRFPYWIARVAEGGEVLAPGRPDRPIQLIDARDLADWMVRLAEGAVSGVLHATGPAAPLAMAALLDACRMASSSEARFTWVEDAFLVEHKVGPWEELPFWIPEGELPDHAGILRVDVRRAVESGLTFRPLADTARDTWAWEKTRGGHDWRSGLAREKERQLLEEWRQMAQARG